MNHPLSKSISKTAKKTEELAKKSVDVFNCRAPYVFSIPRMYEDDYERNDQWYFDLQKMEKQAKELRIEFAEITRRCLNLHKQTKKMVAASLALRSKHVFRASPSIFK